MILLPDNSARTELKVNPKNWQTSKASIKKDWYIYYRVYPSNTLSKETGKRGKLIIIKGMNHIHNWEQRITETKRILSEESIRIGQTGMLLNKGSKPFENLNLFEIPSSTTFIDALRLAEQRINVAPSTKRDLKSTLQFVSSAAESLGYATQQISDISRRHIKNLLFYIDKTNGESVHRYNKIRSYLMMIYKELVELEAVEYNPVKDISKKKGIQKLRKVLSLESRNEISAYLRIHHNRLWLFTNIFFHSGARLTEMMNLKRKDVDLEKQTFIITIKKGNIYKEVLRPIKTIALSFWIDAIANAGEEDFIFSKGLVPGPYPIQSYQITKRWNLHIKRKLGIKEDFYSLKHLNLDQTAELLSLEDAAAMASHSSSMVTSKYYAHYESKRQMDRLKEVENNFSTGNDND